MKLAMSLRRAKSLAPQALLVLALAALLAACGASAKAQTAKGGGSGAGKPIDACALVTRAEAAALLGVPVGEAQPKAMASGITACHYLADAPGELRQVFVWASPRASADGARRFFDETKQSTLTPGSTTRDQAGLGDGAFWLGDQLWLLKGKVILTVAADSEANTVKLAGQVLRRLP